VTPADILAAIEDLERCLDTIDDDLAIAVFALLVGVRDGSVDHVTCRVTARGLLAALVGVLGDLGGVASLVRMLAALALLPEGDDRQARALDPSPAPGNAVEGAIADLLAGRGAADGVQRALLDASVVVPVLDLGIEGDRISLQLLPVVIRDRPMVSVFTSAERFADYQPAPGAIPTVIVDGWELPALCPPGHGIVVNPGSVLGCVMGDLD
jgi:hypothetical protein